MIFNETYFSKNDKQTGQYDKMRKIFKDTIGQTNNLNSLEINEVLFTIIHSILKKIIYL